MELGSKVVVLFRDTLGVGAALFDFLHPLSPSKREVSSFDLSPLRGKYGIAGDERVTVEIAQFFAPDGSVQASLLLLANLQPPTAVCAINELLLLLASDDSSESPMVILPHYIAAEKLKYSFIPPEDKKAAIFGIEIGSSTVSTQAMLDRVSNPPVEFGIHCEPLSCLMHLIHVYKMPGILLVGTGNSHANIAANNAFEALHELGQFLADRIGLFFAKETACLKGMEGPETVAEEPWKAMYG